MVDDYYPPDDEPQQPQSQPPPGFTPYTPVQASAPPPGFTPYKPEPPPGFTPYRPKTAEDAPPIKSAPPTATPEERRVIYGDEPLGTPSGKGGLTPRPQDTPDILSTNKAGQTFPGYVLRTLGEGLASIPERLTKSSGQLQRQGDVYDPAPAVDLMQTMYGARALGGGLKFRAIPSEVPRPAGPSVTPAGQYQLPLEGTHQPYQPQEPVAVGDTPFGPRPPQQGELPLEPPVSDAINRQGQTAGSDASAGVAQDPRPPAAEPVGDPHNKATLGDGQLEKGGENLNTRNYGKKGPAAAGDAAGVNVIKDGVDPTVASTFKSETTEPAAPTAAAEPPAAVPTEPPPAAAPAEPPAVAPQAPAAEPARVLPEKQPFYDAAKVAAPTLSDELLTHIANLAGGPKAAALMARNAARRMAEEGGAPIERAPVPAGTMELPPVEVRPPEVEAAPLRPGSPEAQTAIESFNAKPEPVEPATPGKPLYPHAALAKPKLEKAYEKARADSSKITDELIEAGRGNEKGQDIAKQTDELSQRYKANSDLVMSLADEINRRKTWGGTLKPIPEAHRNSFYAKPKGQQFAPQEQFGGRAPPKVEVESSPIEPTGRPVPEGARAEVNGLLDKTTSAADPAAHLRETAARARELGLERQARRIEAAAAEMERQQTVEYPPGPGERSTGTLRQQQEGVLDSLRRFIADESGAVGGRRKLPRTPAEEKVLSRLAPDPGMFDNLPKSREEASSRWREFYASSLNELDAIEQLKKRSLTDVAPEVDPGVLARLTRGLGKRIEQVLNDGTYDVKTRKITGDPLKTTTAKIEADEAGFMAYAMARTAIERDAMGVKTGIDIKAANQVVAQSGAKWGPVSNELNGWKNRMLDNAKDILGSKAVADIKKKYPGHIALHRLLDPASETGQALGGGLQARNPLHRLSKEGSEAPILNPLDSTIKDSVALLDMSERNRVGMAMEDLNNTLGPNSKFMREVKDDVNPIHVTAGEINKHLAAEGISEQVIDGMKVFRKNAFTPALDRIRVFRDGKAKTYEVPEEIGRAFHAMDAQSMHMAVKIMGAPARWLRAGATLTPEFGLKNPLRDQIAAFTQTKYGYIPVYDFAVGLGHLFERGGKHSDMYQRWAIEGGGNANLVSLDRRLMYEDPKTVLQHVGNVVTTPYKMLQLLGELGENATRLGIYSRAVKRGAHPIEASFEAREGTVDFQRMGASMIQKVANALIPFYNVGWQGTDRALRAFRDRPVQTGLTTAVSITLPSVALWYLTKDDERIQQLPRWRKDVAWNFPGRDNWKNVSTDGRNEILDGMGLRAEQFDLSKLTHTFRQAPDGSLQYNDATIWALPKPPGIGQLFGSIPERMLDAYFKKDPKAFDELGKTVWQAFAPALVPQAMLPFVEHWANKSNFLDRALVPDALKKLPPSQQYTPQTSDTARAIGDVVRTVAGDKTSFGSPAIIDNYMRAWAGGLGKHVTDMLDAGIFRAKDAPVKPSWSAADVPLLKGFVARFPSGDAEAIKQFYDTYEDRKMAAAGIKNLQKKGLPEDPALLRENPVQGIHNALSTGFKTVRNIMDSKTMSPEDKRAAMDLTYLFMIEKAKQGNAALEQSKRARTPPPNFTPYQPGVQ